ncbi:MAG: hypothetical protein JWP13_457, partial [Candidatus Saccharibacteria bacterium]|nr:hypothetical protein [Candidatus Saccharibacteria bacterium]
TATSTEALLPTIQSRVSLLQLVPPAPEQMKSYFIEQGYASADIDKALMLAGHLPGLTSALLSHEEQHPLHEATVQARALLQSSVYERLLMVDGLSKQRELIMNILSILSQMARMALMRSPEAATRATERWQRVLKVSFEAEKQLRHNTSSKLVLMRLMLEL